MFQTKKSNLIKTGNYVFNKGYFFLLTILIAYAVMVVKNYLILPCWSDNIWYVWEVNSPQASVKLLFRFFNYYVTKIMIGSFLSPLKGCALFSLLYHMGIGTFSYLIALRVAGKISAILAAILTLTCPVILYQATFYGPDAPCLFFGLVAIYFSLSVGINSRYSGLKIFLAGFFLVGAIFSKITGICFVVPVIMILLPKLSKKYRSYINFISGIVGAMLFLSICDRIWLGNFFYHIDPRIYLTFFKDFGTALSGAIEKSGTDFRDTFLSTFRGEGYIQYLIYIAVYLVLLTFPRDREIQKKYYSFSIFLIAIISLIIHEGVHVKDTILKMHDTWFHTLIIPFILSFCCLLPLNNYKRGNSFRAPQTYLNTALTTIFVILLFLSKRELCYFEELKTNWRLLNSLIHVFSFWFFLLGIGVTLFFGARISLNNKKWFKYIGYLGLVIIIWYSTTWGNIIAKHESKDPAARRAAISDISNFFEKKVSKTLVVDVHQNKLIEDTLNSMFLDNSLNRTDLKTMRTQDIDIFEVLRDHSYEYLLTPEYKDIEFLNEEGKRYGLSFEEIKEIRNAYFYKVRKE